jgi:hypothetical protein
MGKKIVKCASCAAEREITEKPEPKTPKENKQISFICKKCGAWNLRDGTAKLQRDAGSSVSADIPGGSGRTPNGTAPEPALIKPKPIEEPQKTVKVRKAYKKKVREPNRKEPIKNEEIRDPFIPWL